MPAFRSIVFALILIIGIINIASSSALAVTLRLTSPNELGNLNGQTIYVPIGNDLGLRGVVEPTNPPPSGTYQWTFTGPYQVTGSITSRAVTVSWTTRGTYTATITYTAGTTLTATVNVFVTGVQDQVELTPSHPCGQESPTMDSSIPTWINFTNYTNQALKYYWLDYTGQRFLYGTFPANMPGNSIYQPQQVGHNWVVTDENDVCLGIYTGIQQTGKASLINVSSVQFEIFSDNVPLDLNPNTGGGRRIFPDTVLPGETGKNRSQVSVKAILSHVPPGKKTVYFRNFDIDDPTTDLIIDPNGNLGDDNRVPTGTPSAGQLTSPVAAGQRGACTVDGILLACPTDAVTGIATAYFTTTKQPGDNFAIAASLDKDYLNGVTISGTDLKDSNAITLPIPTGPTVPASLTRGARSEMLTVWRKLHIELDSMGSIPSTGTTNRNSVTGTFASSGMVGTGTQTISVNASPALEPNRFENGRLTFGTGASLKNLKVADSNSLANPPITANTGNTVDIINPGAAFTITAGQSFTLFDDDDFNDNDSALLKGDEGENVTPPDTTMMTSNDIPCSETVDTICNSFAPAYIKPYYDLTGSGQDITFSPNTPESDRSGIYAANFNNMSNASKGFWAVYLLGAYQYDTGHDFDPDEEGGTWGAAEALHGIGAFVFMEINRATEYEFMNRYPKPGFGTWQTRPVGNKYTTTHEIGHLLDGDHPDCDDTIRMCNIPTNDAGLMAQSPYRVRKTFTSTTLNKMRNVTKP